MLMYPRLKTQQAKTGREVNDNKETMQTSHAYSLTQKHKFFDTQTIKSNENDI